MSVTEGQVAEVIPWEPESSGAAAPRSKPDGSWDLGTRPSGRVRALLQSSPTAEIVVRWAEHVVRVPLVAALERPQETPAQAPLAVSVRRLPWDSLLVDLAKEAASGIVAPSSAVPVAVRYNIVWPEAAEVTVRTTLVLRPIGGGEPVWRDEQRHVAAANQAEPPGRTWIVPAPSAEGTYMLEIHAAWEPALAREGSRLGRLIRRRKAVPASSAAARRVTFAVVATRTPDEGSGAPRTTDVDTLELGRVRGGRFTAQGRSPLSDPGRRAWELPAEALPDAGRREHDRLRGWLNRTVSEAGNLGPADDSGLAWSAVGLRVPHPQKPHRVTLTVASGDPAALAVAMVDPGGPGRSPRLLLDACASGPPILDSGPPASFSWIVWPDCPEPLLILLNRNTAGSVRLGSVKLTELESLAPPLSIRLPNTQARRALGLYLAGSNPLERFGGESAGLPDPLRAARNLVSYLDYCGANLVVLPDGLGERPPRGRLRGQAEEDPIGPNPLDLLLRLLQRQGHTALVELKLDPADALPGLPPPDSVEALRQGLVRVDRRGLADGASYHPLHPQVRQAMKRRVEQALARRGEGGSFGGVLLRLGAGPTLLGPPDSGLDDETFFRFVKDTFGPETQEGIPGLSTTDPERFSNRSKYLSGVGRMPWLTWRSKAIASLYSELEEAARAVSPGARLVVATPGLHSGAAGAEARRVDLAGLAPSQAWRSVGLDLDLWPSGGHAPVVLRGVELSEDPLAHDLATSPDLDVKVARRPQRGILLTSETEPEDSGPQGARRLPPDPGENAAGASEAPNRAGPVPGGRASPRPPAVLALRSLPLGDGVAADEPLGHALAALDAHWVVLDAAAIAGHEERIRQFATVFRALPAWPPHSEDAAAHQQDFGLVVRSLGNEAESYLAIANDTPYPVRLAGILEGPSSAVVEDLGRGLRLIPADVAGGRQLVLDVLPFGVSAIRIGSPGVRLTGVTPYPSEAVMTAMEARYRELSTQLSRLNRGQPGPRDAALNLGFEPDRASMRQTQNSSDAAAPAPVAGGWSVAGAGGSTIAIDPVNPHGGEGSLKLTAPKAPAAVVSERFVPASAATMVLQAFFRSEPAGARVRVWIEGEAAGQRLLRHSEIQVSGDWESRAVRASDLPGSGLDKVRLRFELMTPGTLWIDDVRLLGEVAPESVRLNAQRTLLAALQAYRARRYAEFARLAGSHWARHPSLAAGGRGSQPGQLSSVPATGEGGAAAASALSSDRTVR